jgi:hypothetical protein
MPETDRLNGEWTIFLARWITGRDGTLVGTVAATISLQYFSDLFDAIDRDNSHSVALVRRDGTVVVLHPRSPGCIGRPMPDASSWYQVLASGGRLYQSTDYVSRPSRSNSVQPLRDYPLVIDMDALAAWRQPALYIGLGTIFFIFTLLGLFQLSRTRVRRLASTARDPGAAVVASRSGETALAAKCRVLADERYSRGERQRHQPAADHRAAGERGTQRDRGG